MESQAKEDTYEVVVRPEGVRVHREKYVHKTKLEPDQSKRRKVRWVIQGQTMQRGTDFKETFAPVARLETVRIRIVLTLAAYLDLDLGHWDVKTAFLAGLMEEAVYTELPKHYESTKTNQMKWLE